MLTLIKLDERFKHNVRVDVHFSSTFPLEMIKSLCYNINEHNDPDIDVDGEFVHRVPWANPVTHNHL